MKKILFMLALASRCIASADQIILDGSQNQFQMQLKSAVYKTLYREEVVETTCYREVFSHNENVCSTGPSYETCERSPDQTVCGLTPSGRECNTVPGHEVCSTNPGSYSCDSVARYTTESYSCSKVESIPYQQYDYDIENEVVISVDNQSGVSAPREILNIKQSGASLDISAVQTTGAIIIKAAKSTHNIGSSGSIRRVRTIVNISLFNKQLAYGAFLNKASELVANKNGLSITIGPVTDASQIKVKLFLERKRLLAKDRTLIDRTLKSNEFSLVTKNGKTALTVDFGKLGVKSEVDGNKITATLSIQSSFGSDDVVNKKDLPSSSTISKSVKQKLK